jgi:membrane-bound serine protease (ClpP class)
MRAGSFFGLVVLVLGLTLAAQPAYAEANAQAKKGEIVILMRLEGALTAPMVEYLNRGLQTAAQRNAEAVILRLNTPGGSIDLMTRILTAIRGSMVPVVVYVSPRGAMAGSAGTMITLAGHAAAMAPETAIGAASPVGSQGEDLEPTLKSKEIEILKATARSLADWRGPAAVSLAEDAIEKARAVSYFEARQANLVDFIATDDRDLIRQLDGYAVQMTGGEQVLKTAGLPVQDLPFNFIEQLLGILTNPNIVFLLLTIGVQAILIELSNPGAWLPGFVGVVCLSLAAYGLGFLPVNWFGIVFITISFVLFILEVKSPAHGALAAAGAATFIVGALVLFNSPGVPQFQQVSVPLVIGAGAVMGLAIFAIVGLALRAQSQPVHTAQSALVGRTGIARSPLAPDGSVQVASELWTAHLAEGEDPLPEGATVVVVAVDGIHLVVKKQPEAQS